jgi:GT2 family glycosyltransferase
MSHLAEPLVSIIIPHFNSDIHKTRFLTSIAETSYPNFEIIIVDDVSTDSSLTWIQERYAKDRRIMISRNRSHVGPAASRNNGIRLARGDFLAFVETDMEVDPHWIGEAMNLFREVPLDVGGVQCKVLDLNNRDVLQAYGIKIVPQTGCVVSRGMGEPANRYDTVDEVCSGAVGLIVRKSTLEAVNGFDESLVHNIDDVDLAWRIWISGWRIVTCPTAIVYHWTAKPTIIRAKTMSSSSSEFHFNKLPFVLVKNYEVKNVLRYLPTCFLFLVTRSLLNLIKGNPTTAIGFVRATAWGLTNLQQIILNRSRVQETRKFGDDILFSRIFERGNLFEQLGRDLETKRLVRSGIFGTKPTTPKRMDK